MPRAYKGKRPTKVIKEAHESEGLFYVMYFITGEERKLFSLLQVKISGLVLYYR